MYKAIDWTAAEWLDVGSWLIIDWFILILFILYYNSITPQINSSNYYASAALVATKISSNIIIIIAELMWKFQLV